MLTVSLVLLAAGLSLGAVALSTAAYLDFRDRDHRARSERQGRTTTTAAARLWGNVNVRVDDAESNLDVHASQTSPDIIVGPWSTPKVQTDETPRKAA